MMIASMRRLASTAVGKRPPEFAVFIRGMEGGWGRDDHMARLVFQPQINTDLTQILRRVDDVDLVDLVDGEG